MHYIGSFDNTIFAEKNDEFLKKYQDTYIQLKINPESNWITVQCNGIENGSYIFNSLDYGIITLNHRTNAELKCIKPNTKIFNHNNEALLYQILPKRQWKVGPTKDNCIITTPGMKYTTNFISFLPLNLELFTSLFNPTYNNNIKEFISNQELTSLPYNNKLTLYKNKENHNQLYIFYLSNLIGSLDYNKKIIYCSNIVTQLLKDNFNEYTIQETSYS